MTKFRKWALGVAGAILIVVGLFSCDNDEVNNPQREETQTTMTTTSIEFESTAIATIDGGEAVPLYDESALESALISEGFYDTIESISVGYGSDDLGYEACFTVIGSKDGLAVAYQADLILDGGDLLITNPGIQPNFFTKHTCAGVGCESCAFEKEGRFLKRRIVGCECNKPVEGVSTPSYCNHSVTQNLSGAIQFVGVAIGLI